MRPGLVNLKPECVLNFLLRNSAFRVPVKKLDKRRFTGYF